MPAELHLSSDFFTDVRRILADARRDDFTDNTEFENRDPRRTVLVCLERSLFTTSKWNLKHFLDNLFDAS